MVDLHAAVEAPRQIQADHSVSSMPEANSTQLRMPDGGFFGGHPTETLTHPGPVEPAQVSTSGENLKYTVDEPTAIHPQEQVDLEMVQKILENAQKTSKSGSPSNMHSAPLSENESTHIETQQAQVVKPTNETGVWSFDWKTVQRFVDELELRTKTIWQKIISYPKAVLKWIFPDTGSTSKPTPLQQSRPRA